MDQRERERERVRERERERERESVRDEWVGRSCPKEHIPA